MNLTPNSRVTALILSSLAMAMLTGCEKSGRAPIKAEAASPAPVAPSAPTVPVAPTAPVAPAKPSVPAIEPNSVSDSADRLFIRDYNDPMVPGYILEDSLKIGSSIRVSPETGPHMTSFVCVAGDQTDRELAQERYVLTVENQGSVAVIKFHALAILTESSISNPRFADFAKSYDADDFSRVCQSSYVKSVARGAKLTYSLTIEKSDVSPLPPTMTIVANTAAEALSRFGPLLERYGKDYPVRGGGMGLRDVRTVVDGLAVFDKLPGATKVERAVAYVENVMKLPRGEIVGMHNLSIEVEENPELPAKPMRSKLAERIRTRLRR